MDEQQHVTREEQAFLPSRSLAFALLSLMDEAVLIIDEDGRVAGWSHGAERVLGYQAADVLGMPVTTLCAPLWRTSFDAPLKNMDAQGRPTGFDVRLVNKGGEERLYRAQMNQVPDSRPRAVICMLSPKGEPGSSRDLPTRQLRELWALLESVPVSFSYMDRSQRILYANKAAMDLVPASAGNVIGKHVREVFGDGMYSRHEHLVNTVLAGQECSSELGLELANGTRRYFLEHLYPHVARDGTVKGCFCVLVDITEAKITQESLLRREHQLRSTLIREINHRVKNSLQGLIGMLRLHNPARSTPGELIDQCVSQLMAVAVSFGLASRHGEARILLCDMVRDIAHSVEQVSRRHVAVELMPAVSELPIPLSEAHSVNMSLVINEIIFNAVKHSPNTPGAADVQVSVDRVGDSALVTVVNSAGRLPEGFSFATGHGLGVGLSLVRVLVPPASCDLSITQQPQGTVAILKLAPPVLAPP